MELPELTILSQQMSKEICNKRIIDVMVTNPKCLNVPFENFQKAVVDRSIRSLKSIGKWLLIDLDSKNVLLFNPGMGVDILHFNVGDSLHEKYQIKFNLDDGSGFTIRVWWFCYLHLVPESDLNNHRFVGKLGTTPLDNSFTLSFFKQLLNNRRGNIKNFLLNQKNIAGIGNVYIQDILFNAKVHPKRKIPSLTHKETVDLYNAIQETLKASISLGGLKYEKNFYGKHGQYGKEQFKIAYKPGEPCPMCKTTIEKIKTGSTSSYICPNCQQL